MWSISGCSLKDHYHLKSHSKNKPILSVSYPSWHLKSSCNAMCIGNTVRSKLRTTPENTPVVLKQLFQFEMTCKFLPVSVSLVSSPAGRAMPSNSPTVMAPSSLSCLPNYQLVLNLWSSQVFSNLRRLCPYLTNIDGQNPTCTHFINSALIINCSGKCFTINTVAQAKSSERTRFGITNQKTD